MQRYCRSSLLLLIIGMIVLLTGCSEKSGGSRIVNIPPDTFISFGPKENAFTYYKVKAYWYGADEDGAIDHFEVTVVRDVTDSTLVLLDLESLDWGSTTSSGSTFVMIADSCCLDSTDKPSPTVEYAGEIWGILVRAIDNEGAVDPTPATVFFTATNIIPKVEIVLPPRKVGIGFVPPHPYIEWEGEDPDGEATELMYKYIIIPNDSLNLGFPRLPPLDYEGHGPPGDEHAAPPIGRWSEWVSADCTYVKGVDLSPFIHTAENPGDTINVYVTAKDEGGAYLPEKLFGSYNDWRNLIRFRIIATGGGVPIVLDGGGLGVRKSYLVSEYQNNVAAVFEGYEVAFKFWGSEDRRQGRIAAAYRYYYDNPDAPGSAWNYWTGISESERQRGVVPEWFVRYPADGSTFRPDLGRHVFVVEIKDVNEEVTHCELNFEVLRGPDPYGERKILLVDDHSGKAGICEFPENLPPTFWQFEDSLDALWFDILDGYNFEIVDTGPGYKNKVPVRQVGAATTVIWVVDHDTEEPPTQLLQACWDYGNYLYSYVKVGGNVIIIGNDAVVDCAYWPDKDNRPEAPRPDIRSRLTSYTFTPVVTAAGDTLYNFMWDVFGIKRMRTISGTFNSVMGCDYCSEAWADTIPPFVFDDGTGTLTNMVFTGAFYITDWRSPDDDDSLYVEPMLTTAFRDESGDYTQSTSEGFPIAIYVPAHDGYGHAAYIGIDSFWFDHDGLKRIIRKLLERFGETPIQG